MAQMRSPQGGVAEVADESVDAFTAAGWSKAEAASSKKKSQAPAADDK